MPLSTRIQYTCRQAGGLFLGIRIVFPFSIIDEENKVYTAFTITFGLIFWILHLDFQVERKTQNHK